MSLSAIHYLNTLFCLMIQRQRRAKSNFLNDKNQNKEFDKFFLITMQKKLVKYFFEMRNFFDFLSKNVQKLK